MNPRKILLGLASVVGVGALLCAATAQAAPEAGAPAALTAKLSALDAGLARVESASAGAMSKSVLTRADFDTAATLDDAYAKAMMSAFETATKDAQTAASSKGASGNVQGLKLFEDLATRHEARLAKLATQSDAFQAKVRSGAVKIDPAVVKSWSPQERQEFMKSLEPAARSAYPSALLEGVDPLAPANVLAAMDSPLAQLAAASVSTGGGASCSAIAPCVSPCVAKNWSACATCLASKAPSVYAYYNNTFMPRWNGQGKGKYTSLAIWRIGVLAAFVKVVA